MDVAMLRKCSVCMNVYLYIYTYIYYDITLCGFTLCDIALFCFDYIALYCISDTKILYYNIVLQTPIILYCIVYIMIY